MQRHLAVCVHRVQSGTAADEVLGHSAGGETVRRVRASFCRFRVAGEVEDGGNRWDTCVGFDLEKVVDESTALKVVFIEDPGTHTVAWGLHL